MSADPRPAAPDPTPERCICGHSFDMHTGEAPHYRCGICICPDFRLLSPAAAPDVPAAEPSAEQIASWVAMLEMFAQELADNAEADPNENHDWAAGSVEATMLAKQLPLLIQRAHDAEARATEATERLNRATDAYIGASSGLATELRDAEQRIAALDEEVGMLRNSFKADVLIRQREQIADLTAQLSRLTSERSALRGKIEAMPRWKVRDFGHGGGIRQDDQYGEYIERRAVLAQLPAEEPETMPGDEDETQLRGGSDD